MYVTRAAEYAVKRPFLAMRESVGTPTYIIDTLGSCWLVVGVAEAEIDGLPPQWAFVVRSS
jgi:hypothetical protein